MKSILVLLVGVMLVGCSQTNYAKKKTTISNMSEFLKVNESVCSQFKSTSKKIYGCGTATSKDFELSKSKSLLTLLKFVRIIYGRFYLEGQCQKN